MRISKWILAMAFGLVGLGTNVALARPRHGGWFSRPSAVPELSPDSAAGAIALILTACLLLAERRRRRLAAR